MRLRLLATIALTVLPQLGIAAEPNIGDPMTASAFSDYVTGNTFTFSRDGLPFGSEEYRPQNRVKWSFIEGQCQDGRWYEENGQICFVYEGQPVPQCWTFYSGEEGLVAVYENSPSLHNLQEASRSPVPLYCEGPQIGA